MNLYLATSRQWCLLLVKVNLTRTSCKWVLGVRNPNRSHFPKELKGFFNCCPAWRSLSGLSEGMSKPEELSPCSPFIRTTPDSVAPQDASRLLSYSVAPGSCSCVGAKFILDLARERLGNLQLQTDRLFRAGTTVGTLTGCSRLLLSLPILPDSSPRTESEHSVCFPPFLFPPVTESSFEGTDDWLCASPPWSTIRPLDMDFSAPDDSDSLCIPSWSLSIVFSFSSWFDAQVSFLHFHSQPVHHFWKAPSWFSLSQSSSPPPFTDLCKTASPFRGLLPFWKYQITVPHSDLTDRWTTVRQACLHRNTIIQNWWPIPTFFLENSEI